MTLNEFVQAAKKGPVAFTDTMDIVTAHYSYAPSGFYNGVDSSRFYNEAGTNEGSCKLFAFAKLNGLDQQATLHCFGDYYVVDVLQHADGTDHQNIRTFMVSGWDGIGFDTKVLSLNPA
ncbi:type III effector [Gammaproteobacteria bacterium 45_16_T64]|nr:type III effector [Gammaproteobacteria bacterium 45_16_T64]